MSSNATIAVVAVVCALGAAGCEATFTPAEPVVAYYGGGALAPAAVVPADIWTYPRVYYGGTYVYLVDGFWYQPSANGWLVYRREPVELSRQRTRIYAAPRTNNPRTPAYGYPRPAPLNNNPPLDNNPPLEAPRELNRERTPQPR